MANILVVDDETSILQVLSALLKKNGHSVTTCADGSEALQILKNDVFDLLIADIRLPGADGLSLLQMAKEHQRHMAVIIMTAYAEVETALEAMKRGAFDYVTKPFKLEELMLTIDRALNYESVLAENRALKSSRDTKYHFGFIIGDSEPMLKIYRMIEKVAVTNSTVFILGDSGSGKELVARALHECSPRRDGPFVKVNCAAMTESLLESELFGYVKGAFTGASANKKGLFEAAHGGTIFLDEIGSVHHGMQLRLLRVLQEREIRPVGSSESSPVDVRVIAASNEDMKLKISKGEFREDLYFRLSVIPIQVPPLRQRKEDIPDLVEHFLTQYETENKVKIKISPDAVARLCEYSWPGNVRQLENMIKRLATLNDSGVIEAAELPQEIASSPAAPPPVKVSGSHYHTGDTVLDEVVPLKEHIRRVEESYIRRVVRQNKGDKEKAAKQLGISLATLYRKVESEDLSE
jgi:DNA-binding NtrC family response regulator